MTKLLLIACGGGAGALLRYWIAGFGQRLVDGPFPLGTLIVNVIGCLLIGFLATLFTGPVIVREEYRFAILVGLLGGFTTFSTFGYETVSMLGERSWLLAGTNVIASNVLGLLAVWCGHRVAVFWQGA